MIRSILPFAAFALLFFAACDKPNETPGTKISAEEIAATYNGYSYSQSAMQAYPWTADGETLTITANSDNTASLTFDSKGEWGSYIIEELSFDKKDNYYTVSGSGKVSLGMGGQSNEYEFTMTGTVKSESDATFVFVASVGAMGDVTTTFVTGSMPDALKIVGKYEGHTTTLGILTEDETLTITAHSGNTASLTFDSKGEWGSYIIEELSLTKNDNSYTVSGSGKVSLGMGDSQPNDYEFTMTGTVKSKTDATFVFVASVGEMGDVTTTFAIENSISDALKISGKYEGYTIADSNMFTNWITEDEVLTLIAADDGTVTLDFTSNDWGVFYLENIPVGNNDGVYTIEGSGQVALMSSHYNYTMSGNIISISDAEITFLMPSIMGGVNARFITGTVPDEETP